jgi:hypothetical protein
MDIEKYRKEAVSFLYKMDKEYYLHFSGIKDNLNVSEIYDEFKNLFSKEYISHFKNIKEESAGEEKKKASFLLKFCTEGYMEMQTKSLIDEIAEDEARAKITVDGKKIPFRYSEILLSNEPDKIKRDAIDDKRNKVIAEKLNKNLYKYWSSVHSEARELGFSGYADLFSYLKDEDFSVLQNSMDRLLTETGEFYRDRFGALMQKRSGITLESSRRSDFAYLKRAKKYDGFFKKDILIRVFKDTLDGMGIDINRYDNINFDVEERENKSPRAFCATPGIPSEIYLVVMPEGGQDDFETILHEGGHALHFGNTGPELDFEYKYLGDNSVTEGYAFSMEQLMQNERWLVDFFGMDKEQAKEFVYFSNLMKLWFCRRYAGKLKYELIMHDGSPLEGKDAVYKEILSEVNLMDYSPESYLRDVDEGFYCTSYIRAWIFQSQIEEYLYRKFGYRWYSKKAAGSFLKELWRYGQKYSPEEILSQLGFDKMNIDYLIYSLIDRIKRFK